MSNSKEVTAADIYTYFVFAVIDKRNGKMQGHEVILTKAQKRAIEDVVLQSKVRVLEDKEFDYEHIGADK